MGVGLALSLCLYKPPLLLLIVPMLVVARKWRALVGFALGSSTLAGVSVLTVGWRGCRAYAQMLTAYPAYVSSKFVVFPKWKFVDLNNFLGLLLGSDIATRRIVWLVVVVSILPVLVCSWLMSSRCGPVRLMLVWAATLTWTLVMNIHTGYYDTILAVPGLVITADALHRCAGATGRALTPGFKCLLTLLYVVPWVSQHLARWTGFQPFTLILMAVGAYQLALVWSYGAECDIEDRPRLYEPTFVGVIR